MKREVGCGMKKKHSVAWSGVRVVPSRSEGKVCGEVHVFKEAPMRG